MNVHRRLLLVAVSGILCFCLGVWLRFDAVAVATSTFKGSVPFDNMGPTIANAARGAAIYDVATPLLWVGGALVVLAAAVSLLPIWRGRYAEVPTRASVTPS